MTIRRAVSTDSLSRRILAVLGAGAAEDSTLGAWVARRARAAGLPAPRVVFLPHRQVNAFVLAGEGGTPVLAVTRGVLESLDARERVHLVDAALRRAAHPGLERATWAAGLGLVASAGAGMGLIGPTAVERHPLTWPLGLLAVPLGAALGRLVDPAPAGVERAPREWLRLLDRLEILAHLEPIELPGAVARLALVDPRGEVPHGTLSTLFPAPPRPVEADEPGTRLREVPRRPARAA